MDNDKDTNRETSILQKELKFMQILNTVLLTIIAIFSIMIFNIVNNVKTDQAGIHTEMIRMKTIQGINSASIISITTRVSVLERDQTQSIQTWTGNNFVRRQSK